MRLRVPCGVLLVFVGACSALTDLSSLRAGTDASADVSSTDASGDAGGDASSDAGGDGSSALGCGAADAGLVAYWPMEEGLGTAVADCSGNGLNATLIGGGTWVTGRTPQTKAIQFDATGNTYVLAPPSALADGATTITLAAWVKLGSGVDSYIIDKGQPPTMSWSLEMETDTSLSFYVSPDGDAAVQANHANSNVSVWFHIAAVYEPGVAQTIYVNGVSFVSAAPPAAMHQTNVQMKIGTNTFGAIDEVRVYSRALGASEIAALAAE